MLASVRFPLLRATYNLPAGAQEVSAFSFCLRGLLDFLVLQSFLLLLLGSLDGHRCPRFSGRPFPETAVMGDAGLATIRTLPRWREMKY